MVHGITFCEEGHFVSLFDPADQSTAASSEVFSMENWAHATIIVQKGAGSACTIQVEECDDFTPTTAATKIFDYAEETTADGDTLTALAEATTAGIAISANTTTLLIIEIDAEKLTDGYPCLRIKHSAATSSHFSVIAILSGGRFQQSQTDTVIA